MVKERKVVSEHRVRKSESLLHGQGIEDFSVLAHLLLLCDGLRAPGARTKLGGHEYQNVTRDLRLLSSKFHPEALGRRQAFMGVRKVPESRPLRPSFSNPLGRVYSEVILSPLRGVSSRVGSPTEFSRTPCTLACRDASGAHRDRLRRVALRPHFVCCNPRRMQPRLTVR